MVLSLKTHSETPEVVLKELPTTQVTQRSRHQPKRETDGMKVENDEDSEVLTLRALLDEKAVEMARREAETRVQIRKLQKEKENLAIENQGFKRQIRQLKHELTRKRNGSTSNASSSLNTPGKIRVKSENSRRLDEAPILIVDDSDEEHPVVEDMVLQAFFDDDEAMPHHPRTPDATPPLGSHSTSPAFRSSSTPSKPKFARERSDSKSFKIPPGAVEVKIKTEDGDDEFKYVSFSKSEDGLLDIWNLDGFDLRPPSEVDEKYIRGFSRKVIGNAFGGGHQACFHNWRGTNPKTIEKLKKEGRDHLKPHVCFNRTWNPYMPLTPGQHGVVFCSFHRFDDGSKVDRPITFFVGENENDWRLSGDYSVKRWGEITPAHLQHLPPGVLSRWIHGALKSEWGKKWVHETNEELADQARRTGTEARPVPYTDQGLTEALDEGRLIINFTIMECVSYRPELFERLVHYERHPNNPKKSKSQKTKGEGSKHAKKAKVRRGGAASEDDEKSDSDFVEMIRHKRKSHGNKRETPVKRAKGPTGQAVKREADAIGDRQEWIVEDSESEYVDDSDLEA